MKLSTDLMNIEVVKNDIEEILDNLSEGIDVLAGQRLIITGGAGFLGYYIIHFLLYANDKVLCKPCEVICIDNFIRGFPSWINNLSDRKDFKIIEGDVTAFDYARLDRIDYIIHAASVASPRFYRKYPIETMDANVSGLRNILEYCRKIQSEEKGIKSLLFFSSSEIYGDPSPDYIPISEEYRGFVSCIGPRACYDESKRYGETLCFNFYKTYNIPVKIVRPFNNYGPGLNIDDGRVIPDFCKNVLRRENIVMYSDGSPMRTFCYINDAVTGYLLALLSDYNGEAFNIGVESPEISMKDLAQKIINLSEELFSIKDLQIIRKTSNDKEYLTDNPSRRCPSINKARKLLGYDPKVKLEDGLKRTLLWYRENM